MQVLFLGRAPRTKETLPDFLKWHRVTRPPLVFRKLTGSQRTPGFWGITQPKIEISLVDGLSIGPLEIGASHLDRLSKSVIKLRE